MDNVFLDAISPVILRGDAMTPLLLVCDHATNHIPPELGNLGLSVDDLARHIAWDPGSAQITRHLSERLNATAVLAPVSRLVIDCNRALDEPSSICPVSDGTIVPGNQDIGAQGAVDRANRFFRPYHDAIAAQLARLDQGTRPVAMVAIHSFTPVMAGFRRPWQIGILWNRDPRLPLPLIEGLRDLGLTVGDNEPYSGWECNYTVDHHAGDVLRSHVSVEFRQDLVGDAAGARRWADLFGDLLARLLDLPLNLE